MKKTLLLLFCLALTLSACGQPAMTAGEEVSPAVDVTTPSVPGAFEEPLPSFPPAGEMLEVDCGEYAPLEDDGSRRVTIWYAYADGTEATDTYDLSSTQAEKGGPTLTISREWATGAEAPHTCIPIDDQADRTYLLERLEAAVFQAPEEELAYASGNLRLFITDGDIQLVYHVFPDGTLTRQREDDSLEVAYGAVDYLRLSAITYKYASIPSDVGPYPYEDLLVSIELERRQESMIPEKLADQWEDIFPTPPAEHYRLCIQGEGFHADLDREQALLLFRTLFGEADTGKMAPLDFAVADWDWTPGEECLRLTEYLDTTGTPYEGGSRIVWEQTIFLYPDGTAARVLMSPHNTYYYSWARGIGGISEVEEITPSWTRVHIAEDVFSWDNLNACLEALSVA